MYKFAHFADVHWRGLTRHDEYKRSFNHAFEIMRDAKVDAIFIAGDIVHSKTQGISPELIDSLCWWFRSMSEIATVYITLGNHDGLVMNKDREDAISPIVRALNLDNLKLIKNSESIDHDANIRISNFSCFDEAGMTRRILWLMAVPSMPTSQSGPLPWAMRTAQRTVSSSSVNCWTGSAWGLRLGWSTDCRWGRSSAASKGWQLDSRSATSKARSLGLRLAKRSD